MLGEDYFEASACYQVSQLVVVLVGFVSHCMFFSEFSEVLFCEHLRLSRPLARFLVVGTAARER